MFVARYPSADMGAKIDTQEGQNGLHKAVVEGYWKLRAYVPEFAG